MFVVVIHCQCCVLDGRAKDFTGMNEAAVERADTDALRAEHLVLGVQADDVKFLLLAIGCQPRKVFLAEIDSVLRAKNAAAVLLPVLARF